MPVFFCKRLFVIFCALTLVSPVVPAFASSEFLARNKQRVAATTVDGAMMEVFSTAGASAPGYFCAAADYAIRRLGANWSDRVVVIRPEAQSATRPEFRSVLFSVRPWQDDRASTAPFLMSVGVAGVEYTNTHSLNRCNLSRFF
ncbi:MAG: hypothetical protein AAGA38_13230 [Pseudomonadota bacterium]